MDEKKQEAAQILRGSAYFKEVSHWQVKIPDCCRNGSPDCVHVLKKKKLAKGNVGL